MSEKRPERPNVAAVLPQESIRESVPELVGMELAHAGAAADARDHPPKRLRACRLLRILQPASPLELRHPLLDLDCEYVIVKLNLQPLERVAKLVNNTGARGR